jgi:hypothetical protein
MTVSRIGRVSTPEILKVSLALVLSLCLVLIRPVQAQTATGIPMYSTMANGPIDHINVGDLGVSLIVPVRSKTGPIPLNFIWYQQTYCDLDRTNAPQVIFNCNHGVSSDHGIANQPVDGTIQFGTADLVNCPDLLDGEKSGGSVSFNSPGLSNVSGSMNPSNFSGPISVTGSLGWSNIALPASGTVSVTDYSSPQDTTTLPISSLLDTLGTLARLPCR